jgi:hypothetical protein
MLLFTLHNYQNQATGYKFVTFPWETNATAARAASSERQLLLCRILRRKGRKQQPIFSIHLSLQHINEALCSPTFWYMQSLHWITGSLPFTENFVVSSSRTEMCRNVGNQLPRHSVSYPKQIQKRQFIGWGGGHF